MKYFLSEKPSAFDSSNFHLAESLATNKVSYLLEDAGLVFQGQMMKLQTRLKYFE